MPSSYLVLLRRRDVTLRLASVFTSAITLGMMSLTIVLCVREWSGSFALGGLATGLFSLGNAVGIAWQGRLLDKGDGRAVIGAAGAVFMVSTGVFVAGGSGDAPRAVLLVSVAVAGASVPAVTTAVRTWLPSALPSGHERTASYALLSVVFQAAVTVGPLLVGLCVLLLGAAAAAVVGAVLVAVATLLYLWAARDGAVVPAPARRVSGRRGLSRGLVVVLGVTALLGAGSGALVVAVPVLMTGRGTPALSGVLFAAVAAGEVCGALGYGARAWRRSRRNHLVLTLLSGVATYGAAVLMAPSTGWLAVALLACGTVAGPVAIVLSALIDDVAPADVVGRAYALLVTTTLVAAAAGSAAAGLLADLVPPTVLLAVPAAASGVAAAWVLAQAECFGDTVPLHQAPA